MNNWSNVHKWIVRYGDDPNSRYSELDNILQTESGETLTLTKNSALHFSAISLATNCLEKFVEMYPHLINGRNDNGETPLHWACANGTVKNIKILLHAQANRHMVDYDNNSILHFAVQNGNYKATKLILRKNLCDIELENTFGKSALYIACQEEEYKIMKLLIINKAKTSKIESNFANNPKIVRLITKYVALREDDNVINH